MPYSEESFHQKCLKIFLWQLQTVPFYNSGDRKLSGGPWQNARGGDPCLGQTQTWIIKISEISNPSKFQSICSQVFNS